MGTFDKSTPNCPAADTGRSAAWGAVYLKKPGAAIWIITAPNCLPVAVRAGDGPSAVREAAKRLGVPPERLELLCRAKQMKGG